MKIILSLLFLSTAAFADISSIERPNMYYSKVAESEILENMDHTLSNIHNELAVLRGMIIQSQRSNELLSALNDNLISLIGEQQKTHQIIEVMAWQQDHMLDTKPPSKKGP